MPDRFSEEEARQIFARAAERQHADDAAPAGLSLAELQEIGKAAGLDPAHVAAAVAEVQGGAGRSAAPPATFLGVDVEPRASRVLPAEVTDAVWGRMVGRLRPTFKTIGVTSKVGAVREWQGTNERGGLSNLRMTAAAVEGGTLVTLETSRAKEARQYRFLPPFFAVMASLIFAGGVAEGATGSPALWTITAVFLAFGISLPAYARHGYVRWAERRQGQFDGLLDQFELLARDADAAPPERHPVRSAETGAEGGAGRLDLDAAPPGPEAERPARWRTRA